MAHLEEYSVLVRPLLTEKTSRLAQSNQYVFIIHPDANKIQVRDAVQRIFKVRVIGVRTWHMKGKLKRRGWRLVQQSSTKRAIVTLAKGSKMDPSALT